MTLIKVIIWKSILRRLDDDDGKSITKHFRPLNFFPVLSPVTVFYPRLFSILQGPRHLPPLHTQGLITAFDRLEAPQRQEYLIFVVLNICPTHGTHLGNVD